MRIWEQKCWSLPGTGGASQEDQQGLQGASCHHRLVLQQFLLFHHHKHAPINFDTEYSESNTKHIQFLHNKVFFTFSTKAASSEFGFLWNAVLLDPEADHNQVDDETQM